MNYCFIFSFLKISTVVTYDADRWRTVGCFDVDTTFMSKSNPLKRHTVVQNNRAMMNLPRVLHAMFVISAFHPHRDGKWVPAM